MVLVIENIGGGIARNVTFTPTREIPNCMIRAKDSALPPAFSAGPLVNGIVYLQPGGRRSINWGEYSYVSQAMKDGDISVMATFQARDPATGELQVHQTESVLEVRSFEGTSSAADVDYAKEVAQNIGSLKRSIDLMREYGVQIHIRRRAKLVQKNPDEPEVPKTAG